MSIQRTRTIQALNECKRYAKVDVVHAEIPKTIIDGVEYTLVFPKFLFDFGYYKKCYTVTFEGVITEKRARFFNIFLAQYGQVKNSFIRYSGNGRDKKKKVFDKAYFETLGQSQFVLCPDGDFVWSYRFFEAIICNAIPIVENDSPLYEGYKYYKLGDTFIYDEKMVKHNTNKLRNEMTLKP
jgi:hypothetical protein